MDSPPARQRRIFDSRPDGSASGGGVVRASLPVLGNRVMTPAEAFFCRCSALPCEQKFIAGPHCCNVPRQATIRSEEHTSELQSRLHLVCRLLLEKKQHHDY